MTAAASSLPPPPSFPRELGGGLHAQWNARVDAYFERTGRPRRDDPRMYAKVAFFLAGWACTWALLTFWSETWRSAVPLTVLLGVFIAGIGMNVMHDANHGALSRHRLVNRAFGWTNDMLGASAHVWTTKHNVVHHTFTNVEGVDDDLEVGALARMSPAQRWYPWHRAQHLYMWLLYGFLLVKWVFFDDYANLATARVGTHRLPKMKAVDTGLFVLGKVTYLAWNVAVPLTQHAPAWVIATWLGSSLVGSLVLAVTFQLAHCVEETAMFEARRDPRGRSNLPLGFFEHQVATTMDFGRGNALVTFLVGGLNYQTVHHLVPRVSHVHYPALSRELEAFCREHGVRYTVQSTWGALRSHFRFLRSLGEGAEQHATANAA
jgi:linoleoyl-CoA desaturase